MNHFTEQCERGRQDGGLEPYIEEKVAIPKIRGPVFSSVLKAKRKAGIGRFRE
jgi:hypothetical protein